MTLAEVIDRIRPADEGVARDARARHDRLTKPPGSLGRLEVLGIRLAAVYGTVQPVITGKGIAVFAADHGVTAAGVSAYPKGVTAGMVQNFLQGGAAINALSKNVGASLLVVDVGVDADLPEHPGLLQHKVRRGTADMRHARAMTVEEAERACKVGAEVAGHLVAKGANLLVGGEMGIGNTTAAAALTTVFTGHPVREVTGRGTGVDDAGWARKVEVLEGVVETHRPSAESPLETLSQVGGLEIAALTGFYLAAASHRVPIILDGFISTSAALVAVALCEGVRDYLFASHLSQEPGHRAQLRALALEPLFDLDLRLGEGSGAALALPLLEGAAQVLAEMATFEEAGLL